MRKSAQSKAQPWLRPEYRVWSNMIQRCHNTKAPGFKDYGGRGISVCAAWRNSFWKFLRDVGERPFPEAQLDRRDNNGNYEPDNCRWVTPTENMRNRRGVKLNTEAAKVIRWFGRRGVSIDLLARLHGVSTINVCNVVAGRLWREKIVVAPRKSSIHDLRVDLSRELASALVERAADLHVSVSDLVEAILDETRGSWLRLYIDHRQADKTAANG